MSCAKAPPGKGTRRIQTRSVTENFRVLWPCQLINYLYLLLQEHFYLETQATIAVPKGEDGEMELFVSTQNPTLTQVMKQ